MSSGRRPSRTAPLAVEQRVGDEDGVLEAGKQQPLLERVAVDFVDPDRQAGFEPELAQPVGALDVERAALAFFAAQPVHAAAGQPHAFAELAHHHESAERGRRAPR